MMMLPCSLLGTISLSALANCRETFQFKIEDSQDDSVHCLTHSGKRTNALFLLFSFHFILAILSGHFYLIHWGECSRRWHTVDTAELGSKSRQPSKKNSLQKCQLAELIRKDLENGTRNWNEYKDIVESSIGCSHCTWPLTKRNAHVDEEKRTSLIDKKGRDREKEHTSGKWPKQKKVVITSANTKWNCTHFWAKDVLDLTRAHIEEGKGQNEVQTIKGTREKGTAIKVHFAKNVADADDGYVFANHVLLPSRLI